MTIYKTSLLLSHHVKYAPKHLPGHRTLTKEMAVAGHLKKGNKDAFLAQQEV